MDFDSLYDGLNSRNDKVTQCLQKSTPSTFTCLLYTPLQTQIFCQNTFFPDLWIKSALHLSRGTWTSNFGWKIEKHGNFCKQKSQLWNVKRRQIAIFVIPLRLWSRECFKQIFRFSFLFEISLKSLKFSFKIES